MYQLPKFDKETLSLENNFSLDYMFDSKSYPIWSETTPTPIPCWYPCHTHVDIDMTPFIPSPGNIGCTKLFKSTPQPYNFTPS